MGSEKNFSPSRAGALERVLELVLGAGHPEALAAAPAGGLAGDRVADLLGLALGVGDGLDRPVVPGTIGTPGLRHQLAGAGLGAHRLDRARGRADERDPGLLAGRGEVGVLGQEPVAGVDRLGAGRLRRLEQPLDVQVALGGHRRAEQVGLVGLGHVGRVAVGLRVDADRDDPHLLQRPHDADRDLAPVGDEDLLEHGGGVYCDRGRLARLHAARRSRGVLAHPDHLVATRADADQADRDAGVSATKSR